MDCQLHKGFLLYSPCDLTAWQKALYNAGT